MTARPYSRVYWDLVDDPMFERVFENDKALATWLRMLLIADAMWPASAPMTTRNPTVRLLIDCGLVIEKSGNRYTIRGLQAERERRSAIGRNAAAVRYQRDSTANAMPRRDEKRKEETSNGANAHEARPFMGFRPRPDADAVKRQDAEQWRPCSKCGVVGRKHSASGEHKFQPVHA